ncbi:alpha-N-acetylglucosaminidase [Chondrinema litorale]|uniref:alpha-N-acetylglucosaminidase n=1 Tax=Chondrinema litorale TaxID=2994555 RepID=UPI0025428B3F|nr:alpha-N-acetylglucosaminidase [Chondrinema litorale]UZR96966.1 alpha-N-acetylglucosaminidase [Chondrinema litorale]
MRRVTLLSALLFNLLFFWQCSPTADYAGTETTEADTTEETDEVAGLVKRIMKDKASEFKIEYIESDNEKDVFELESVDGKIVLRGNNGVSVASALNHYLKHFLHCEITWNGSNLNFPEVFPEVSTKIRNVSPYKYRYYLNYCTFNYSMAWWDWERWQWEIDWMALNGINMPLALTGEEAIWRKVYTEMGFSKEELGKFFSGPAYFSWLWMGNIDAWGGPLPDHWMDTHMDLQKKILAKERAFGMKPILPAFTGHVPPTFKDKFPDANLLQTNWDAGFDDVYILNLEDPMFDEIGAAFLKAQNEEYGTDHYYSADTFNENVPPSNDSTFLSKISHKVFQSMANTDPEAVWVMQGWMFHYNDDFWHPTQIQALFGAIPDDQMIILDLYSESHPVWNRTDAYYGKPWIWNMLQNFGGNVAMFGRMENVAKDPSAALHDPNSGKMKGIGLTPEGNGQNPALFHLMLENVWTSEPINVDNWLEGYAHRRYGKVNEEINKAWQVLENTVYSGGLGEGGSESILVARPTFEKQGHRVLTKLDYDPTELLDAWKIFIEQTPDLKGSEGFEYDMVDLTRQVLANYANPLQQKIRKAYEAKDQKAFKENTEAFLAVIEDMDKLLQTHEDFLLGKWIKDARSWGETKEEQDLYEFNARDQVTLWGDKNSELHEYSNRQWAGLLRDFYKPRWEQYFVQVAKSMETGTKFDQAGFEEGIKDWEWKWANKTGGNYTAEPKGDAYEIAKQLYDKYYEKMKETYASSNM